MMRKGVDYHDAALLATYFRAPLHVLKAHKRALDLFLADPPRVSRDNYGETVEQIELSQQWGPKRSPALVFAKDFEARKALAEISVADLPLGALISAESLDSCKQSLAKRFNYFSDV